MSVRGVVNRCAMAPALVWNWPRVNRETSLAGLPKLSVQADELAVPVLLDTRRSSHLATGRDRNRTRRHQN